MFGKPPQNGAAKPSRPALADLAKIQGGGLVQVIVVSLQPLTYYLFLNDKYISQMDVESLSIAIEISDPNDFSSGVVRATLSRHVNDVTGGKTQTTQELFPCTMEIIALGRRLSLTATQPGSLDGLWIDIGLKPDGTANELGGLKSLRFLLTEGLLDAKITWMEGDTEDILPQ